MLHKTNYFAWYYLVFPHFFFIPYLNSKLFLKMYLSQNVLADLSTRNENICENITLDIPKCYRFNYIFH